MLPNSPRKLLVHIEDPGAANFVMPLVPRFRDADWACTLMASGTAADYLGERGIAFDPLLEPGKEGKLLERFSPDLLLVGTSENPESPAFAFVEAARRAGMASAAAVDGPANSAERFRGRSSDPLRHAPDWLLLTEEWMRGEFERMGFPSQRIIVTGHPYFDLVRREGRALLDKGQDHYRARHLPDAPQHRPVIAFLTEGSDGLGQDMKRRSAAYTLDGWGRSERRTEIVLEEFLDAADALSEDPYLVLRLHPKETADMYAEYLPRFDAVSSGGNALPLLCACDLVVGLSTSLLAEAAIMGLRTLSILPHDGQRDLILTVRNGVTPCATDRRSLRKMLGDQLRAGRPSLDLIDEKIGSGATERVMAALETLVGTH